MQNTDVTSTLEALNREIGEAEKRRDVTFLDGVLADALVFRRASGAIVNKGQYMADLVAPYNTYERLDSTQIEVTLHEDTAIVSLLVNAKGMRRNAEGQDVEFEGIFRNTRIFLKSQDGNDWRCSVWFNTKPEEMVLKVGVYRVRELPEEAAVAKSRHELRSGALHEVFDNSTTAQVLNWGDTDDDRPHEFVEALVVTLIGVAVAAAVDHIVVPGIKALVQKLRERNVEKESAQTVGEICAQLAAKREAGEIKEFYIKLPDNTFIAYGTPASAAGFSLQFNDGTESSVAMNPQDGR